ncbi:HNH endonuclease [Prosthecobacter sp.]|uniref:HNH endonuclease n=1 Tax=Prosthecobacter sp. TaxID=1965333 RepID=UPI003784A84D
MNPRYPLAAVRAGFRCEYCHAPQAVSNSHFEVEHILPLSLGGDHQPENLALACPFCNVFKGSAVEAPDPGTGTAAKLFHPRTGNWDEHFTVNVSTLHVVGLTPTGRATVERLRMNRELAVLARGYWVMIGLFP